MNLLAEKLTYVQDHENGQIPILNMSDIDSQRDKKIFWMLTENSQPEDTKIHTMFL